MASSSPSSAPAKLPSSQPLHNFELPPLLKWNSKDGKPGVSHKRHHRSMKSPPQRSSPLSASPRRRSPPHDSPFKPPLRDFAPPPPRIQIHLPQEDRTPPPPQRIQTHLPREDRGPPPREPPVSADSEAKEPALDGEFERLALLREEALRHYRGRDWWSETKRSDVIAYRRNPLKKSGFSASSSRIGRSSNSEFKISDSAGEIDVYRRNSFKKSSFTSPPARPGFSSSSDGKLRSDAAGENYDVYRRNPFKNSAFAASLSRPSFFSSDVGKRSKATASATAGEFNSYHRHHPFKKSFSSNFEERKPHKAVEKDSYHRNPLKKCAFAIASSPKKSEERKSTALAVADTYRKNLFFKKSAFSSSKSKDRGKIEKKSTVAEADTSSPKHHLKKSAFPSPMTKPEDMSKLEKKSKVAEGDHSPKKSEKSPFASPAKKLHASSSITKKSKAAEEEADAKPKKQSALASPPPEKSDAAEIKKGRQEAENPKKEVKNDEDEEIKVWNLRPRVKSKPNKASTTIVAGNNPKNKGRQLKSGGGGEKKEEKLSIAISLTKQEIEEDIFALTGAKPSRRPKKRPKNVQKHLDNAFPGLWLLSITSDSYRVSENSLKG